jgi:hypothetical protein
MLWCKLLKKAKILDSIYKGASMASDAFVSGLRSISKGYDISVVFSLEDLSKMNWA